MELDNLTPLLVDILAGAVLLLFFIIGAKRGLMRSLMGIAVLTLALLGAGWCAAHFTEPVCQWLMPLIEKRVAKQSPLANLGIHLPNALSGVIDVFRQNGHTALVTAILEAIRPIVKTTIYLIVFILLTLVLKMVSKLLRIVEKLPVIHSCNKLGGALLGLLGGIVVVFVALWAAEQFHWLPAEVVQDSSFAKYFVLSTWIHNPL